MDKTKLQWHPAFSAALRITLQDEMKYLEMHEEYLLGKKPLQMDILLIKKIKNISIRKSIGRIFREHNIIEYKSPDDYLSINDFYKVYAYACLYQSDTDKVKEIDPETLTITFVCSHYPREMFRHLTNTRGIIIEDKGNGIYYLKGDPIPMQLLLTPKLSEKENYWLISRHCRSMTVARRMPARASTAVALRAYRTRKQAGCSSSPHPACYLIRLLCLYLVVLAEVIVEIIIEIVLKVFQVIRCEETVYRVCDSCYRCHCSDDSKDPDHSVFLFLSFIPMQKFR